MLGLGDKIKYRKSIWNIWVTLGLFPHSPLTYNPKASVLLSYQHNEIYDK